MFNPRTALLILPLTALLAACGGSDNDDDVTATPTGDLRVIHASPDAPIVDVTATPSGGATSTPVTGLDYAATTGFLTLGAGSYDFDVLANLPGGTTTSVLTLSGTTVAEGQRATLVVSGTADAADSFNIEAITVDAPAVSPGANEVSLVVAHASTAAAALGDVDVYVTPATPGGTDVSTISPTLTFGYTDTVDASAAVGALPAGEYQIQVTGAGSDTVVYDSGTVDLSPFAGSSITIIAANTTNQLTQAASPVKLLAVVDGSVVQLLDTSTQAGVKVVHVSPDAGDVDVAIDDSVALEDVAYLDVASAADAYIGFDAGSYALNVQGANTGTDVLSQDVSVDLAAGREYSVLAMGNAGDIGTAPATALELTATADDNRSVATQASVKVVHGAPGVGMVDVYVTSAGTVSVADIEGGMGGTPLLADFAFRSVTDYVPVTPGDYDIRIADASTNAVAINVEGQTLGAGAVVTAIAYQPDGVDSMPSTAGLLLLTN